MPTPKNTSPTPCSACASTAAQLAVVRRSLADLTAKLGRMTPDPAASYLAAEGLAADLRVAPVHPSITVTVRVGADPLIHGEELRVEAPAAAQEAEETIGVEVSGAALAEAIKPAPRVSARAAAAAERRASIAKLASEGRSPAEIARELDLDPSTVYGHLRALRGA